MAIQLAIEDTTGVSYPESYHMITSVRTDGLEKVCQLKIQVYASSAAFAAGKTPLSYNGWSQDFYLINCTPEEYLEIASCQVAAEDVGLPVKNAMLKSAYMWLMQQNSNRTQYFDYTQGIIV